MWLDTITLFSPCFPSDKCGWVSETPAMKGPSLTQTTVNIKTRGNRYRKTQSSGLQSLEVRGENWLWTVNVSRLCIWISKLKEVSVHSSFEYPQPAGENTKSFAGNLRNLRFLQHCGLMFTEIFPFSFQICHFLGGVLVATHLTSMLCFSLLLVLLLWHVLSLFACVWNVWKGGGTPKLSGNELAILIHLSGFYVHNNINYFVISWIEKLIN